MIEPGNAVQLTDMMLLVKMPAELDDLLTSLNTPEELHTTFMDEYWKWANLFPKYGPEKPL